MLFSLATLASPLNPYVVAPAGNACPGSASKITTASDCKAAGSMLGLRGGYQGTENDEDWPAGCYHCNNVLECKDGTWFNEHSRGSANGGATPICYGDGGDGGGGGMTTGKILLMGDSDIEGWDTSPDTFPGSANVGVGGATCKDVLKDADRLLAKHRPTTVILVCGENDLAYGTSVSKTFERFKDVVEKVTAFGTRVIYVGTKPEPSNEKLHADYREYDRRISAYAAALAASSELPPLRMVDSYNGFEDKGNPSSLYQRDELHLSKAGYKLWDEWTLKVLAEAESGCTVWRSGRCTQGGDSPPSARPPPPSLPTQAGLPSADSFVGVFAGANGKWTAWVRGQHVGGFATGEAALEGLEALEGGPPPRQGVQVLDGGSKQSPSTTCVDPTSDVTAINGKPIAAQCCDKGGNRACRRVAPDKKNDDEGCIAGFARNKPPEVMTYAAAQAKCAALGLDMCEKSCSGTGCYYNNYPVYTKLTCELKV